MTDEYLTNRGYKEYPPSSIDNEYIVALFQKRFDDEFGKKYFIDVKKWSQNFIPEHRRGEWWKPFSYEYGLYTTFNGEENPINISFGSSWTIEEVEKFAEDFFNKMKPNYYESWDGKRRVKP